MITKRSGLIAKNAILIRNDIQEQMEQAFREANTPDNYLEEDDFFEEREEKEFESLIADTSNLFNQHFLVFKNLLGIKDNFEYNYDFFDKHITNEFSRRSDFLSLMYINEMLNVLFKLKNEPKEHKKYETDLEEIYNAFDHGGKDQDIFFTKKIINELKREVHEQPSVWALGQKSDRDLAIEQTIQEIKNLLKNPDENLLKKSCEKIKELKSKIVAKEGITYSNFLDKIIKKISRIFKSSIQQMKRRTKDVRGRKKNVSKKSPHP